MKDNKLPFGLLDIEIRNFRGIAETNVKDIPGTTPWIFLTGRNGYGKTCVLQAIFIGLFGSYLEDGNIFISDEDDFGISVKFLNGTLPPKLQFLHYGQADLLQSKIKRGTPIPIVGYGPSRLSIQASTSRNEEKQKSAKSYSLFNTDGVLLSIENELKNWEYRANHKDLAPEQSKILSERSNKVKAILLNLLPNLVEIQIDPGSDSVKYFEKDQEEHLIPDARSFEELASGNKSIIAMVGDLVIRLFKMQPQTSDPSELEGIVIIDELDLHLHPDWQKKLPNLLTQIFPKIQFIASTHSAIPILGAPDGSVFLTVNRSKEHGITIEKLEINIEDLTPNLILSSPIFGFTDIFPAVHDSSKRIRSEDTMEEVTETDQLMEELKSFIGKDKEQELLEYFKKK